LIVGLHRFGRLGPDEAIVFELSPPRKKKRRKQRADSDAKPADTGGEGEASD